jgi:hypothetical protein
MEFDRIKVAPTISNVSDSTYLNDEDANTTVAVVSVVRFDEAGLGSLYEQKLPAGNQNLPSIRIQGNVHKLLIFNCFPVSNMSLNSEGLHDLAKHLPIADCFRDHNLDS